LKDLNQISVIGLGLLGGSISLGVLRSFPKVRLVGYTHRAATRAKARQLAIASEVVEDLDSAVTGADLVIVATPIYTFKAIFASISGFLSAGCILTDVGSTKVLPHQWARRVLPKGVHYVGSHPIAGSEQRGLDFARDDLFDRANCILTTTKDTNNKAVELLSRFWSALGCRPIKMRPAEHDRILANVSHVPHITAASLINANRAGELKFAGRGFIDTSRVASGPPGVWSDVLLTNKKNISRGIERVISELLKLKEAVDGGEKKKVEALLEKARSKRDDLMKYKIKEKEIIS